AAELRSCGQLEAAFCTRRCRLIVLGAAVRAKHGALPPRLDPSPVRGRLPKGLPKARWVRQPLRVTEPSGAASLRPGRALERLGFRAEHAPLTPRFRGHYGALARG